MTVEGCGPAWRVGSNGSVGGGVIVVSLGCTSAITSAMDLTSRRRWRYTERGCYFARAEPFPSHESKNLLISGTELRHRSCNVVFGVDLDGLIDSVGHCRPQALSQPTPTPGASPVVGQHAAGDTEHVWPGVSPDGDIVEASPDDGEGVGDHISCVCRATNPAQCVAQDGFALRLVDEAESALSVRHRQDHSVPHDGDELDPRFQHVHHELRRCTQPHITPTSLSSSTRPLSARTRFANRS